MAYRSTTVPAVPAGHMRCKAHGIQKIRLAHNGTQWCRVCRQAAVRVTCSRCGKTVIGACTDCAGRVNLVRTPSRVSRAVGGFKTAVCWTVVIAMMSAVAVLAVGLYGILKVPSVLAAHWLLERDLPLHAFLVVAGLPTLVGGAYVIHLVVEWLTD